MKAKMRCVPPGGRKLNNKGFSLIEVLVAMVILAIIVVPVMHSFVTTMNTNGKARKTERVTAATRNVMEGMKGLSVEDIVADIQNSQGSGDPTGSVDSDGVITWNYGEPIMVDGATFYAKIVLDGRVDYKTDANTGITTVDDTKITHYNESEIKALYDMDEARDAIYIQEKSFKDASTTPPTIIRGLDEQMASRFGNENLALQKMFRTITIDVKQDTLAGGKVRQMVYLNYAYTYQGQTKYVYSQDRCIYDGTSAAGSLENVYLFFEPMYNSVTAGNRPNGDRAEVIEITNRDNVPVNVHLLRMEKGETNPVILSPYGVTVKVEENRTDSSMVVGGKAVPCTKLRTNLNYVPEGESVPTGEYRELILRYKYKDTAAMSGPTGKITVPVGGTNVDLLVKTMLDLKGVNDASVLGENVYKMTVSIYESEEDRNDNKNALFTMEGAKER